MTQRLYYDDAYQLEFDALVVDRVSLEDGRCGVVLESTCFYPTSGGQMHDRGTLAGLPVEDVVDEGGRIVHVVAGEFPETGSLVAASIDGERRAHHRQQHTGQHVLSRVVEDELGWPTVSSRLGESMNTLEIAAKELSGVEIERVENLANRLLWSGRPVRVRYLGPEEAVAEGIRQKVERTGPVRVIEVEGLDRCACGGTHVANTSEVGLVAITGREKIRGGTRLLFLCGERAVHWRRERVGWLDRTARGLTTGMDLVPETVARLQEEVRERKKRVDAMARELVRARAAGWVAEAERIGGKRAVLRILDGDESLAASEAVRAAVALGASVAAAVVDEGAKQQVLVAAADPDVDCGRLVGRVLGRLGGRGGGQPDFARGGCAGAAAGEVVIALREELASDADQGA